MPCVFNIVVPPLSRHSGENGIHLSFYETMLVFHHLHRRLDTIALEDLDILALDRRIFVLHRNHRPGGIAKSVMAVFGTIAAHGEMAHVAFAGIEVAMPHEIVGRIDRADFEFMTLSLLAVPP